jgi:branched-chain amino acid transport system permease protein
MTNFLQLTASGIALGCLYALVALGFIVVIKATGVFNLMQGGFVLLGAYLTYNAHNTWHLVFPVAVAVAVVLCAAVAVTAELLLFRRLARAGPHGLLGAVLLGLGLLIVTQALVTEIWGDTPLLLGDPFGLESVRVAGVAVTQRDLWVMGLSAALLAGFWYLFQRTRLGVAMRAFASDREAALAQGISPTLVASLSWAIAATVGVLAGVMLGSEVGGGVTVTLGQVAFAALPALILGGAGSVLGAVVGGIVLGLAHQYAAGYAPVGLGQGFGQALPFGVMILILVARPRGLFGAEEVRRA